MLNLPRKNQNPLAVGEWVRILRLLGIYAAGSPECRTHVRVFVLVHMTIVARIWLHVMKRTIDGAGISVKGRMQLGRMATGVREPSWYLLIPLLIANA
jgi:hypothetical protein